MSTMDLRQALAGLLTLSMFIMLGNMIKKDHFDSIYHIEIQATPVVTEQSLAAVSHLSKRAWKENGQRLKPCWNTHALKKAQQSKGFITFSLTNGPEYHISQIADAVVVARYLGATLVLPDIRSSKSGYIKSLGDIYDVQNFVKKLDGLVRVTMTQPAQVSNGNPPTVKVPNSVSKEYIVKKVKPIYKAKKIVKIESYFPSVNNTTIAGNRKSLDPFACQAMFGTLQLQSEIQEIVDSMVQKLQTWSQNSNGQFIAVDLRTARECDRKYDIGRKHCYRAQEIGEFLKMIGFNQETTVIYVTQTNWNPDLDALKHIFPKTYTKESVMAEDKKGKFLSSENSEFEKVIDFYVCAQSEVFVSSTFGLFYTNVAGMRIALGKHQTLVPGEIESPSASVSALASHYMSPYVSRKNHFAYACFC